MKIARHAATAALACWLCCAGAAHAQSRPDPAAAIKAQAEAIDRLKAMNGVWRGTAWTLLPSGERKTLVQTERIGVLLQGSLKVVEGRGYDETGHLVFNAFGVISFDPATGRYTLRSYAQGRTGDFALQPTDDGYTWEIPAGPAVIRYVAVVGDGKLRQTGERLAPGSDPVRVFEMVLTKVGETDWPAAGAVGPK